MTNQQSQILVDPNRSGLKKVLDDFFAILKPPFDGKISDWVESNRKLHSIDNAEGGDIDISRTEYTREWLDCRNDPRVRDVTVVAGVQVGKSEVLISHLLYGISEDPGPVMMVSVKKESAEEFSKERFTTNLALCKPLKDLVSENTKDPDNTITNKLIAGSRLNFVGSNSPADLCSKPKRDIYYTEVGRYKQSAGKEGSAVKISKKRSKTFEDSRFHYHESSPGIEGECEITELYELGSQEKYHIPCPHCGELQDLVWRNVTFDTFLEGGKKKLVEGSARYECEYCKDKITKQQINRAVRNRKKSKWIAKYPKRVSHRSFHLNTLYSPWITLDDMVVEFLNAQESKEALMVFINTYLAETWQETYEAIEELPLFDRRENYNAIEELPNEVCYITAAFDTQDKYLEGEIKGWGRGEESWSLEYITLHGDTSTTKGTLLKPTVWDDLERILAERRYPHPSGVSMRIGAAIIDTQGHSATSAYKFCMRPHPIKVFGIKGHNNLDAPLWPHKPSYNNSENCPLWMVGVNNGKDMVNSDLQKTEFGPGYCHHPNYSLEYFKMLTAEERRSKKKNGKSFTYWHKVRTRNEAWDVHVYGRALIEGLRKDLDALSDDLGIPRANNQSVNGIIRAHKKQKRFTSTKTYRRRRN